MNNLQLLEALSLTTKPVGLKLLNRTKVKAHAAHVMALVAAGGGWKWHRCKGHVRTVEEVRMDNPFVPCHRNCEGSVMGIQTPTDPDLWALMADRIPVEGLSKKHWYDYINTPRQPAPRY